ncbi:MAG: acyltransferase family protein [Sedimenticola sp.]|nr:acyltransferase family protein [Sedimenticola sp.]
MNSKSKDIYWVDIIRVIATFSVVWLHSAAPLLYKYNELSITNWWVGNIYDSTVRMCVPLFFMLSGYLLLSKSDSLDSFFRRRISKVVFPLIVWSVLYILWTHYYEGSASVSFYSFYSLALTPAYYHLWFLYAIVGLYLFLPILRVLIQNSNKELQYYFVVLWFVAVSFIPFLEKLTEINSRIDLQMISGYVGYLVIGHLLGSIIITRKALLISAATFVVSIIITSVGTYILTLRNEGVFVDYLYSYLSPNIILMSMAFFILVKYYSETLHFIQNDFFRKIISLLSSASLGIYLIHTMILYVLRKGDLGFSLSAFTFDAVMAVPATAITAFILSFFVIYLVRKIPIIQKIAP